VGGGPRQGGARRPDSAREQPAWRPCWRRWRGPGHPLRLALHPGVTAAVPPPSQKSMLIRNLPGLDWLRFTFCQTDTDADGADQV
jgi:hypothetical protein